MQMRDLLAILAVTVLPSCLVAEELAITNNGSSAGLPSEVSVGTQASPVRPVLDRAKVERECYRAAKSFGLPDAQIVELLPECVAEGMGQPVSHIIQQQPSPIDAEKSEKLTQLACQESVRDHPEKDREQNYKACLQENLAPGSAAAVIPLNLPQSQSSN